MPKSSSPNLFNLIKSLTGPEKRYIKVALSVGRNRKEYSYAKLFDAIDLQDVYNEKGIKIDKEISKHFPKQKERLFEMILKQLRFFNSSSSENIKLEAMLNNVEILFEKQLYAPCEKIINKVLELNEGEDNFHIYRRALELKRKIIMQTRVGLFGITQMESNLNLQFQNIERERNVLLFRNLYNKISSISARSVIIRDKFAKQELNKIMRSPLLKNIDNALTISSKAIFFDIHFLYNIMTGNNSGAYLLAKDFVSFWESIGYKNRPQRYMFALFNLNILEALLIKEAEYKTTHNKIIEFFKKNPKLQKLSFPNNFISKSLLINRSGRFDEADRFTRNFIKALSEHNNIAKQSDLINIYLNICCMHLGNQNYQTALTWLNKILALDSNHTFREDIDSAVHVLRLIIHFELESIDFLESNVRSTHRYLLRKNRLFKFEDEILKFIRVKLPKVNNRKELIEAFKTFHPVLYKLSKDPFEKSAFQGFDFVSWLESKIEQRPFADVVREKVRLAKK